MQTELYRHFDADDRLLYVGISISSVVRLIGHRDTAVWFGSIAKITIERFPDRSSALAAERSAIEREKPLFNISSGWRSARPTKTVSVSQAAALLGIDADHLRQNGHPVIKPEPHWSGTNRYSPRYSREAITAFLAGGE